MQSSDQHINSSTNNTVFSNRQVRRIETMTTAGTVFSIRQDSFKLVGKEVSFDIQKVK